MKRLVSLLALLFLFVICIAEIKHVGASNLFSGTALISVLMGALAPAPWLGWSRVRAVWMGRSLQDAKVVMLSLILSCVVTLSLSAFAVLNALQTSPLNYVPFYAASNAVLYCGLALLHLVLLNTAQR